MVAKWQSHGQFQENSVSSVTIAHETLMAAAKHIAPKTMSCESVMPFTHHDTSVSPTIRLYTVPWPLRSIVVISGLVNRDGAIAAQQSHDMPGARDNSMPIPSRETKAGSCLLGQTIGQGHWRRSVEHVLTLLSLLQIVREC